MTLHRRISGYRWHAIAVLACTLGLVASAHADSDRGRGRGSFVARYAEDLGLDADTQARVQEIVAQSETRDDALRDTLRSERRSLHELLRESGDADMAAVMAQADRIGDAESEIHKNRLRAILEIRSLLTPEQRQELVRLREDDRGPRDGKHRRRGLGPCHRDLRELCPDATDGQARLTCLDEHWDALSDDCRDVFDPSKRSDRSSRHRGPSSEGIAN